MLTVLAGVAQMERMQICERTKAAMSVKKSRGERIGAVPYGYDLSSDGTTLVENPAERAVIEEIRSMRSSGGHLQPIARSLTAHGVPTKTGKSDRWTHQAVARILRRSDKVPSTDAA